MRKLNENVINSSFNNKARHSRPLTRVWFTNMFLRAMRWDKNRLSTCEMRRMYPSHFCSRLMLFRRECKVNVALRKFHSIFNKWISLNFKENFTQFSSFIRISVILKKSPKLTVLKYWNKKLFLLKYFAGDH